MGILRADIVSHSQLEPTGSVLLDGNSDYLSWSDTSIKLGTSDFTLEAWINITSDTAAHQTIFMAGDSSDAGEMVFQMITANSGSAIGSGAGRELGVRVAGTGYYSGFRIVFGEWTHVACVRDGGTLTFFVDGVQGMSHAVAENLTTAFTQIGYRDGSYNGYFNGYISNARIALGALYKNSFTPSKFELENVAGTLLLCCQSSTSATTAAVKPGAITAHGTAAASAVIPDVKKDIIDVGVVLGDNTKFDTLSYMVPPGGTTTQSNRGRGLIMGGAVGPNGSTNTTQIKYFDIASQGTTNEFGQTSVARRATGSVSSSTRAVMGGGFVAPPSPYTISDVLDYVTIATTSNATDFGNMQSTGYSYGTASNETRGIFAGGYRPNNSAVVNTIDLITIATTGNASNFGDLSRQVRSFGGAASTTRGVFFGGTYPAVQDTIDYVTIATAGDATDFGNLTDARDNVTGGSSSTRGVMGGGRDPSNTNIIDYITIASTGNATDFGDLLSATFYYAGTSNSTRTVWIGDTGITNTMEYLTIASTGNSVDWGDQGGTAQHSGGACSDSHGGLS